MNLLPPRLTRRLAIAGGVTLIVAPPALAHASQSVLTIIEWNPASFALEISHRIHAGDAQAGLDKAAGAQTIDFTAAKNQMDLLRYVEKHFSLSDGKKPLALAPRPAELQPPETIILHQQAKLLAPPAVLLITNQILCDVFSGQTNLVNVRLATGMRTLIFAPGDGPKQVNGLA